MPAPISSDMSESVVLVESKRKKGDPTQSLAPHVHGFATHADRMTFGRVAEIQETRTKISQATLTLQTKAQKLKERLDEYKTKRAEVWLPGTKETLAKEFLADFRTLTEDATDIWKQFGERHKDILEGKDLFIDNFTDHTKVTDEAVEKCIENLKTLRERIERVDWPESDALLTTTLELNIILLRFLHEIGRELANSTRTIVANQKAH